MRLVKCNEIVVKFNKIKMKIVTYLLLLFITGLVILKVANSHNSGYLFKGLIRRASIANFK